MMARSFRYGVLAIVIVGSGLGACARRESADGGAGGPPRRGGTLVLGLQQEPDLLDNILQLRKASRAINNAIFSRFVTYDDSLRLVPDLITRIPSLENGGISPDHLTYTYELRDDVLWHDGVPLTSADVRFTYEIIMDPAAGAESQQGWDVIDRVETPTAYSVVFRLREPYTSFVEDTFYDEDVLPKHLLEGKRGSAFPTAAFHRAPVGSGPFVFEEWVPASHIRLKRNERYRDHAPYLDAIVFKFIPEAVALGVQLRTGELQGCDNADVSQLAVLEQIPGMQVHRTPSLAYTHVTFNCARPPLDDVRVRQALAMAVDRAAIATHVFEGLAEPALSGRHPLTEWYNPIAPQLARLDLAGAQGLLEAAGWRDSDGDGIRERDGVKLAFELHTGAGRADRERLQQVLQQEWRLVGADVQIRNFEMRALIEKLHGGEFDAAVFGWNQQPDPSAIAAVYGSNGPQNFGRWASARFDSLAAAGAATFDAAARRGIYRSIEEILLREVPAVPIVWHQELDVMTQALHNYRPNPGDAGDTWNVHEWWLAP
jgi:peptide/nickel transport system substrate-binding protein